METITLENSHVKIDVLKDFGGKITSLYFKPTQEELLFQPTNGYHMPFLGEDFSLYDTSGIDDCFPTVDPCVMGRLSIPDHGSLWSIPWVLSKDRDVLHLSVQDPITGILVEKKLYLEKNHLKMSYQLTNITKDPTAFLWVFHGLFQMQPKAQLILPMDRSLMMQVHGKKGNFNLEYEEEYPAGESFKWYFSEPVPANGTIGYRNPRTTVLFHYDRKIIPYLGLWVTTGGFKGEVNWALEPSTGFYDSLEKVRATNTEVPLEPGEKFEFTFTIEIKEAYHG